MVRLPVTARFSLHRVRTHLSPTCHSPGQSEQNEYSECSSDLNGDTASLLHTGIRVGGASASRHVTQLLDYHDKRDSVGNQNETYWCQHGSKECLRL